MVEARLRFGGGHDLVAVSAHACGWGALFLILLAPAILNGWPLYFSDSTAYLSGFSLGVPGLSPYYFLLAYPPWILLGPWGLTAVQAAIALSVLGLAGRCMTGDPARTLAVAAMVVLCSQLPWLVSWIMPDFLAGVGMVALVALMVPASRLSWPVHLVLLGAVLAAMLVSTANLLAFIPIVALLVLWALWRSNGPTGTKVWPVVAVTALALLLPVAGNVVAAGRVNVNTGGGALLISRLADEGLLQAHLDRTCPSEPIALCAVRGELVATRYEQSFLWTGEVPLADRLDAWSDPGGRFQTLALQIIRDNPGQVALIVLRDVGVLLASPTLTVGFELMPWRTSAWVVERDHPGEWPAFLASRQQVGTLMETYPATAYAVATYLSLAALALVLVRPRHTGLRLAAFIVIGVIASGIVVQAALVGPYPRYFVKLAWPATFVAAVWLVDFVPRVSRSREVRS